ncbi:MAG: GAF domain-containing protein [Candidatus Latescibacteria bacterium]|nr:GAF domain-containing protein [Candidatus Latescibacterota bacterium]
MADSSEIIKNMRVLFDISALIRTDTKLELKFEQVLEKVKDAACCQSVSLFIADDSGKLEEIATIGTPVELIKTIDFDMGSGFSAWVAKQRKSVLIPNLRESRHKHFRSFVSTPLISNDRLIGVMNLGHEEPDAFTEENLQLFEIIAEQLALMIERTNYEQELIKKNEALVEAQDEIKKQNKQIIEMEKFHVMAQMAASVNHEINNPLTSVIGNVELILMSRQDLDDIVRKKLTVVLEEAHRIGKITQKLRDMKRIVVEDYLKKTEEKMIDLDSSSSLD